jgi:hypothetical protein
MKKWRKEGIRGVMKELEMRMVEEEEEEEEEKISEEYEEREMKKKRIKFKNMWRKLMRI